MKFMKYSASVHNLLQLLIVLMTFSVADCICVLVSSAEANLDVYVLYTFVCLLSCCVYLNKNVVLFNLRFIGIVFY